jgi:putative redox protein
MQANVRYLDGVRFEAEARGHRVICDQPVENKGADTGMSPPEFLLISLSTCAAFYALQYLKTRSLPAEGLSVKITAGKALGPPRLESFQIEITVPGLEDERHREGVLRAAKSCLIHHTLLHPARIEMVVTSAMAAAV